MGRIISIVLVLFSVFLPSVVGGQQPNGTPLIAPFSGAPLCATHDDRTFHTLWNATLGCHYDHEHHDDPHALDAIFGTQFYTNAGGEISYPWATFSAAGAENHLKHQGYKWYVVDRSAVCDVNSTNGCIRALRVQVHQVNASMDAVVRFHSFAFEAQLCRLGQCGIIRRGGWLDFGYLVIDGQHVPLANDPPDLGTSAPRRIHFTYSPQYIAAGKPAEFFWYGKQRNVDSTNPRGPIVLGFQLAISTKDFMANVSLDPMMETLFGGGYDGSLAQRPHLFSLDGTAKYDSRDGALDGQLNFSSYADRYGNLVSGCAQVSLDCIPVSYEHVPVTTQIVQFRGDGVPPTEYDIGAPFNERWITFPN